MNKCIVDIYKSIYTYIRIYIYIYVKNTYPYTHTSTQNISRIELMPLFPFIGEAKIGMRFKIERQKSSGCLKPSVVADRL